MTGLMMKIFREIWLKKNIIELGFSLFLMLVIVLWGHSFYSLLFLMFVIIPQLGICPIQYTLEQDAISCFDKILLTYPVSRSTIMFSRLLATLFFDLTLYLLLVFPIIMIYVYVYHTLSLSIGCALFFVSLILSFIFLAIYHIVFEWLGNKKGMVLYAILVGIFSGGMVLTTFFIDLLTYFNLHMLEVLIGEIMIALICHVTSYRICLRLYNRKYS